MGQIFRKVLIDVFREAQQTGDVPPGFNPAESAKKPQVRISRQRLTFDEWMMIYNAAEKDGYFLQRGMLLALMTGQRLSDICKMQFRISGMVIFMSNSKKQEPGLPSLWLCVAIN